MERDWITNSGKIMERVSFGRQQFARNGARKLWLLVPLLQQIPECEEMNDDYIQDLMEKDKQQEFT
jgi:hypothetical protein